MGRKKKEETAVISKSKKNQETKRPHNKKHRMEKNIDLLLNGNIDFVEEAPIMEAVFVTEDAPQEQLSEPPSVIEVDNKELETETTSDESTEVPIDLSVIDEVHEEVESRDSDVVGREKDNEVKPKVERKSSKVDVVEKPEEKPMTYEKMFRWGWRRG